MPKPVVRYRPFHGGQEEPFEVGKPALIGRVFDHPKISWECNYVRTSLVTAVDENGVDFETLNTRYVLDTEH